LATADIDAVITRHSERPLRVIFDGFGGHYRLVDVCFCL